MVNGIPDMDLESIILLSFEILQMIIIIPMAFVKMKGEEAFTVGVSVVIWQIVFHKISP